MPAAKADVLTRLVNEHHSRLRPTILEPPPPVTSSGINGQTDAGEAISMGVVPSETVRPRRRRGRITRLTRKLVVRGVATGNARGLSRPGSVLFHLQRYPLSEGRLYHLSPARPPSYRPLLNVE